MLRPRYASRRLGGPLFLDLAPADVSRPHNPHWHANLNAPLLSSKPSNHYHQSNNCQYHEQFHDHLLQAC